MKKSILLLLFCLSTLSTSEDVLTENDRIIIKLERTQTLKNIKKYKIYKNNQILKLKNDLLKIKQEFARYKKDKEYELNKIRKKFLYSKKKIIKQQKKKDFLLEQVKKKLRLSEKKLSQKNKEINNIKPNISTIFPPKIEKKHPKHQILTREENLPTAVNIAMKRAMDEPIDEQSQWLEVVIEN